jgi:hypothetical protein
MKFGYLVIAAIRKWAAAKIFLFQNSDTPTKRECY